MSCVPQLKMCKVQLSFHQNRPDSPNQLELGGKISEPGMSANVFSLLALAMRIEAISPLTGTTTSKKPYLVAPESSATRASKGTAVIFPFTYVTSTTKRPS